MVEFRVIGLIRAPTGRRTSAPQRSFVASGKTAACSGAKFGMTIPSSLLHTMCRLWPHTLKDQVTRSVWMTQPHIIFLQIWARVRARADDRAFWKLQMVWVHSNLQRVYLVFVYQWPKVWSIYWHPHYIYHIFWKNYYESMGGNQMAHFFHKYPL